MGAFGGFLGGLGQGVQNQQQADGVGAGGGQQQKGSGAGSGLSSMFGGQWGILPIIQKALGGGAASSGGGSKGPAPVAQTGTVPSPTANGAPAVPAGQPTAPHQAFSGILPMMKGYYASHQAKVQDAAAAPHVDSLNDPTITPEQQAYHLSNLQSIYAGRPEMLKQYGIQSPGAAPANVSGGNQ